METETKNGFFVGFCPENIGVVVTWLVHFTQAMKSKSVRKANVHTNLKKTHTLHKTKTIPTQPWSTTTNICSSPNCWSNRKKNVKTLEANNLEWMEEDVKKALTAFTANRTKPPVVFWSNNKGTEVLCKELTGSETNGWAKMSNHALVASLIKGIMLGNV